MSIFAYSRGEPRQPRGPAPHARPLGPAPTPRLPSLPPVEETAAFQLLGSRGGSPSAEACWTAFKAANLHRSAQLANSWEELFHPPGFQPRGPEAVLDWLHEMDVQATAELAESFAEFRRLHDQLRTASLRAREAVSLAAWLHYARSRACASDPEFLG